MTEKIAPSGPLRAVDDSTLPPLAPGGFTHAEVLRVVTGIMLCILLAAIDQMVVIPALPQIAASLGTFEGLSWVVTAYLLTSISATPICAKLSDLFGRRRVLLACIAVFTLSSIACAASQTILQLVFARACQGLGGAGLMAVSQSAVADVVSPRERGRYQVYMTSMWASGCIVGPIVGGLITEYLSWRWIFWMNLPIGFAAIWFGNRALKLIPIVPRRAAVDWFGSLLMFLTIAGLLLVLHWGGRSFAWFSPEIAGLIALSAGFLTTFVIHERRHSEPLIPPRLIANSVFLRGLAVAFLNSFGLFAVTLLLPVYFLLIAGLSAGRAGLLIVPLLGSNAAAAYIGGQLTRRTGTTKPIILAGLVMAACGFALLTLIEPITQWSLVIVAMMLVGAGSGAAMPTVLILIQNAAETRDIGSATGTMMLIRGIGGALGTAVVGAILATRLDDSLLRRVNAQPGGLRGTVAGQLETPAAVALTDALQLAFVVCTVMLTLAALVALRMRDQPLRTHAAAVDRR